MKENEKEILGTFDNLLLSASKSNRMQDQIREIYIEHNNNMYE